MVGAEIAKINRESFDFGRWRDLRSTGQSFMARGKNLRTIVGGETYFAACSPGPPGFHAVRNSVMGLV